MNFLGLKVTEPRRWSDMSTEAKLGHVYIGATVCLWFLGSRVPVEIQGAIALSLLVGATILTVMSRRSTSWRWRGLGPRDYLRTLITGILMGSFAYVVVTYPTTSPPAERLGFDLGIGGIILFNLLQSLRIVYLSKADFMADCELTDGAAPRIPEPDAPIEPRWKRRARVVVGVLGLTAWLSAMGLFYAQGQISRYGSPVPTEFQTARYPLESGPLYVTPFQKDLVSVLLMTCGVAALGSVALGLLLRQKYGQPLE